MPECQVCHLSTPQTRVHYGGVSCYSCRAFFRRNTKSEDIPTCKAAGHCQINTKPRKQCAWCRYQKCIRIGMSAQLVLTEGDKKLRFRKLIHKKQEERKQYDLLNPQQLPVMPPLERIKPIQPRRPDFTPIGSLVKYQPDFPLCPPLLPTHTYYSHIADTLRDKGRNQNEDLMSRSKAALSSAINVFIDQVQTDKESTKDPTEDKRNTFLSKSPDTDHFEEGKMPFFSHSDLPILHRIQLQNSYSTNHTATKPDREVLKMEADSFDYHEIKSDFDEELKLSKAKYVRNDLKKDMDTISWYAHKKFRIIENADL